MMSSRVIVFVKDLSAAETACDSIRRCPILGFDMEGKNLGRNASVSLVQIAVSPTLVYIFDVLALGASLFGPKTLLPILTDPCVLKLCYDCRCDCETLYHQFAVQPYGFYDLQIVYTYLFQNKGDPYLKGYHKALQMPGILNPSLHEEALDLQSKIAFKKQWKNADMGNVMFERPLYEALVNYCAIDVVYLFKMFEAWHISRKFIVRLTYQRIYQHLCRDDDARALRVMSEIDFGKYWRKPVIRVVGMNV